MKKILSISVFLFASFLSEAATQEIDISRGHLWPRATLKTKIHSSGIGAMVIAGSRYNFSYSKTVNEKDVTAETENAWLQELWLGPTFGGKLGSSLKYSVNLMYQPRFWYVDDDSKSYVRHGIWNAWSLNHSIKKVGLTYRVVFWDWLPVSSDNTEFDNEFITRLLVAAEFPLFKNFSAVADEEVYLKLSADETDLDGTEVFSTNAISAGIKFKPVKEFDIALKYVNMFTNKQNTEAKKISVYDHYIMIDIVYALDFSAKKK
jgi:hypothetical protein